MNIAIIFAGGVGSRMGYKDGPKQFMSAAGKPVIIYTLEIFQRHPQIDAIYISTVATYVEHMNRLVAEYSIGKVCKVVEGGSSAQASIICALNAAAEDNQPDAAIALIHDGVRPIVPPSLISQNIKDTIATGSSVTCIPAYETIARSLDGVTTNKVLDRDGLYILQAPQCFRLGHVRSINQRAITDGKVGAFTDMAHLMNKYGEMINLTNGIRGNVKITVQSDFHYFEYLVRTGRYASIVGDAA